MEFQKFVAKPLSCHSVKTMVSAATYVQISLILRKMPLTVVPDSCCTHLQSSCHQTPLGLILLYVTGAGAGDSFCSQYPPGCAFLMSCKWVLWRSEFKLSPFEKNLVCQFLRGGSWIYLCGMLYEVWMDCLPTLPYFHHMFLFL